MDKIILSGMRPTGNLHLGNYFGAMRNFISLQDKAQCYFFIADYHSLTTHPNPKDLSANVRAVIAQYLACGLDPQKAVIYLQSLVSEVCELYMFLNMNAYLGELERVASFKDKVRKNPQNVNAGLLTYPTLMAADILIHKSTHVPVGKDQEQHLEMTRQFASRFNRIYGVEYFPEPVAYNFEGELVKVGGLDGSGKMGKSEGGNNAIFLVDSDKDIEKKIKRAKTDLGPKEQNSPLSPEMENLFGLMKLVSSLQTLEYFQKEYALCTIRYGDMKKQLAQDMIAFVSPLREKVREFESNETYLKEVIYEGSHKAKLSAQKTIKEVREIIGFRI